MNIPKINNFGYFTPPIQSLMTFKFEIQRNQNLIQNYSDKSFDQRHQKVIITDFNFSDLEKGLKYNSQAL